MADRYIETLSNYLQGCKTPEKTDFCEPHPFRLSHIQLFKILIIGLIALSLIHTLYSTASMCYSLTTSSYVVGWFNNMAHNSTIPTHWGGLLGMCVAPCSWAVYCVCPVWT